MCHWPYLSQSVFRMTPAELQRTQLGLSYFGRRNTVTRWEMGLHPCLCNHRKLLLLILGPTPNSNASNFISIQLAQ